MDTLAANYSASARHTALLLITYLISAVVWMPQLSTLSAGPAGISGLLVVAIIPLVFFSPPRIRLDDGALRYRYSLFATMFFLLFWGFIQIFDVPDLLRSARFFLSIGQGFVFITIFSILLSRKELVFSFRILVTFMFISVILSILANFNGSLSNVIYDDTDRAHGLFKNPNQFGMILALCVPTSILFLTICRSNFLPAIALISA